MRLSVALATYNGERFLDQQLESIARQTLKPAECVVGDDGSTDGTLDLLERFARSAPFPVSITRNNQRLGVADNFLTTAGRCAGELIAFCDQDDVWLPRKLERCLECFSDETTLVSHQVRVVDAALRSLGRVHPDPLTGRTLVGAPGGPWLRIPGAATVFAARLVRRIPWRTRPPDFDAPDLMMFHDEWVALLAQALGGCVYLKETLGLYRQHGGNVCGAPSRRGVVTALTTGAPKYRRTAELARSYAGSLRSLAASGSGGDRDRLLTAARFYDEVAARNDRRARLYSRSAGLAGRVRQVRELLRTGAYRSRVSGGLGRRSLAKDLVIGVLGPR